MTLSGNTAGLKKELLKQIEELIDFEIPRHLLITNELAQRLAYFTEAIQREIAVFVDRKGRIHHITIGDSQTAPLLRENLRRGEHRLTGIRCIHTHPSGDSSLSRLDLEALLKDKLDCMAAIGVKNAAACGFSAAFLGLGGTEKEPVTYQYGPYPMAKLAIFPFLELLQEADKALQKPTHQLTAAGQERTFLVGFKVNKGELLSAEESLQELRELALTAGALLIEQSIIRRDKIDPALYIGKGKAKELSLIRQQEGLDLVIFDDELSPRQQRNLQELIGCRVIDRPALILQIFADRARTREGKLQVELAQLNYLLPRLTGLGLVMSRLGGGIGTRGPGETKLETDRRHIRHRINELETEIEEVKKQRGILRRQRHDNQIPVVALVGYTNAGKSTLMNALTQAGVLTEDKLFATLDPTTRKVPLGKGEMLLTDTVGFIHKLPHQLIAAFRATLEEIRYSDILLHVVDASNPAYQAHISTVDQVLEELELGDKPRVLVFNKADKILDHIEFNNLLVLYKPAIVISAKEGTGIDRLLQLVAETVPNQPSEVNLLLPFSESGLLNLIYQQGEVISTEYSEEGINVKAQMRQPLLGRLQQYIRHGDTPAVRL